MSAIDESEVSVQDRVKCACGSEILLKNLKAHEKTKKHQNGGVVSRKGTTYKEKEPAEISVSDSLTGLTGKKFCRADNKARPKAPEPEDLSEDDDEDDFEDIVLDDIKTINDKLDQIFNLVDAGFNALLGGDLSPVPEEKEEVQSEAPIVQKVKAAQTKRVRVVEKKVPMEEEKEPKQDS